MRALVVKPGPAFSVEDVAVGWEHGLDAAGLTVRTFDMGSRLAMFERSLAAVHGPDGVEPIEVARLASESLAGVLYKYAPDLLLVISGFFVEPALLELASRRGSTVVMAFTEAPYEDDRQIGLAPFADVVLINDPTNLDAYRAVQPATHYMPHGWNPAVHYRRDPKPDWISDFVFVGTGYPSRREFLEAVDWTGIDVALAGNWPLDDESPLAPFVAHDRRWCLDNSDAADLYSSTKASANLYRREANRPDLSAGWAMGPREVELAAVSTFYLTEERGENRELLPMVPTFDGPQDFTEKLRWWLAHDVERAEVARQAKAAVADRSYPHLAQRLLGLT